MKRKTQPKGKGGFAFVSIILVLIIIGILASLQLTKYLNPDEEEKDKTSGLPSQVAVTTIPKSKALSNEARNIAGKAALNAAASNVRTAYMSLRMKSGMPGADVSAYAVADLLNSRYTRVGDYVVSYAASGSDRITITLEAGSKGQFGTPSSKEVRLGK